MRGEKDRPTPRGGGLEDSVTALRNSTQDHRGFSLIEMLVASAIFAIAAAVAFIMYSAAQKSYKSGEEFTDQQQSTRVAFDRMLSDIRLAGFNTNPDGDRTRVDEQVEGAWDTAVTIRGDFDFEDASANTSPETALAGSVYDIVSTGNDEIVTYVLAKPGPSGPATVAVNLDANRPRTKANTAITIPNVVLVQNSPPYTLYRVTLADVNGAFPTSPQAASNFVYEPVAENIRTMTFRYYDDGGAELGPNTPASSGDDIGGADSSSVTRGKIRKIHVDLVGMTKDPDMNYTDATDATATASFRKFNLDSDVNMENMGKAGIRDLDATPPPAPTGVTPVPGHAKGMLVKWNTPSTTDGVSGYSIRWWPNGSPGSISTVSVAYPTVTYGSIDYHGHGYVSGLNNATSYCFQVIAKDAAGNQSAAAPVSAPCATTSNPTTPAAVVNLSATGNGTLAAQQNQITLDWDDVQTNTSVLTGDPDTIGGNTVLRDALQYDIKRCTDAALTLNCQTFTQSPGTSAYTDTTGLLNCVNYYYKVWIEDQLTVVGATSALVYGQGTTTTPPMAPTSVTGTPTGPTSIALTWNAVTMDTSSKPVSITTYNVYRALVAYGTVPATVPSGSFVLRSSATGPVTGTVTYTDALSNADHQAMNSGQMFVYAISATDLCGNQSARSTPIGVSCSTNVSSVTTTPVAGASNGGIQPMSMSVNGTGSYTRAKVTVVRNSDSQQVYSQEVYSAGPYTFPSWDTTAAGAGIYTIYWEVEASNGCIYSAPPATFTVVANLACQISPTNPNLSPTSGKPSSLNHNMAWDIVNNSGKDLNLTRIDISWSQNVLGNHKIVYLQYPTGTTVTTWGTGYQSVVAPSKSTATADYSSFPQLLPATANGICGTCKINMLLSFDTQIVDTTNNGETLTIKYYFTDTTNAAGTCQFDIKPDLTIP